jgi:hypothetical protein
MYVVKCDRCGVLSDPQESAWKSPEEWIELKALFGYSGRIIKNLCPKCREELKISAEKPQESFADRLLEILEELVQDVVDARS